MATLTKKAARQEQQHAAGQDQQIVLHGVSWETYEGLLRSDESQHGSVRMSYDRGRLALMSPSRPHEIDAERLGLIVRLTAAGLGLNCLGVGRTTLKREDAKRGKEPDTAFYLANELRVHGKGREDLDLKVDPPPDLVVEVEITHRDPAMLGIYAALRVPEVWHYDGRRLRVLQLQADGCYTEVAASPSLPSLPLQEIPRWLERAETEGESMMIVAFLDWVRNELAPASKPKGKRGKRTS
jgi:Uma2 family endonuclease